MPERASFKILKPSLRRGSADRVTSVTEKAGSFGRCAEINEEFAPPNRMKPAISIVVPLHNEAPNVLPLAQRVLSELDHGKLTSELILVDDGSSDETWQRVLEAQQLDARVRGLRHSKNAGQSAAL